MEYLKCWMCLNKPSHASGAKPNSAFSFDLPRKVLLLKNGTGINQFQGCDAHCLKTRHPQKGVNMSIKIIIKRKVPKDMEKKLFFT